MSPEEASDYELLQRWGDGDRRAGTQLVDRYFKQIYDFFRRRARFGVDDLVQETFLGCVEARDRFRADSTFRTFLFSIGRNVLRAHYRSVRRDAVQTQLTTSAVLDPKTSPTQRISGRERSAALRQAVARLSEEQQEVLRLTFWEERSGAEVARILGVPLDTAYTRIRRARLSLRTALGERASEILDGSDAPSAIAGARVARELRSAGSA